MIQFLKSIALLSLLQTVFSKRSADTLKHYFGTSNVFPSNQQSYNEQANTYFIRKHGLAFVQSHAVKYLNSKSEKVYNVLSSPLGTTKTKRNLFSFTLTDIVKKEAKRKEQKKTSMHDLKKKPTPNVYNSGTPSWAKRTLFHRFKSVQNIPSEDFHHVSKKGAVMASLAGAVYTEDLATMHNAGHSMVARANSADVAWMVTDSIGYEKDFKTMPIKDTTSAPTMIRTITFRGFDATDEKMDRDKLLNHICDAGKVPLSDDFPDIQVHRGLLAIAKVVYKDIKPYIDLAGPTHKIVFNGHSIGGAVANLVLMLLTIERGNVFVQDKVKRVYTYGSPPIAKIESNTLEEPSMRDENMYKCSVLETLGLPADIVFGFVEPWDPIVRLFSPIDAMYPLIGDLGDDGFTLNASGPPRTLRPITRAILESWENWPYLRDRCQSVMKQEYTSIGIQHLLMPSRARFLSDRIMTVNVNAYPVDEVLRVSSTELYSALEETFPLDVFSISLLPTAIRSFVHHFSPAYMDGFGHYVKKKENRNKNKSKDKKKTKAEGERKRNLLKPKNFPKYSIDEKIQASKRRLADTETQKLDFSGPAAPWVLMGGD